MSAIDLPEWFDLESYTWIKSCDEHTLFFEWLIRSNIYTKEESFLRPEYEDVTNLFEYKVIIGEISNSGCRAHSLADHMDNCIHIGDGRLFHLMILDEGGYSISKFLEGHEGDLLPFKRNFTPISIHELSRLSERTSSYEIHPSHLKNYIPISSAIQKENANSVYYEINLEATDKQLKDQFEKLLDSLRKKFPLPDDKSRVRTDFMWKIRHNNYIPIFDLLMVEKFKNCKFKRTELMKLVEDAIDHSNFNRKYINQIKQWSEDEHLLRVQNALPSIRY